MENFSSWWHCDVFSDPFDATEDQSIWRFRDNKKINEILTSCGERPQAIVRRTKCLRDVRALVSYSEGWIDLIWRPSEGEIDVGIYSVHNRSCCLMCTAYKNELMMETNQRTLFSIEKKEKQQEKNTTDCYSTFCFGLKYTGKIESKNQQWKTRKNAWIWKGNDSKIACCICKSIERYIHHRRMWIYNSVMEVVWKTE